LEIHAANIGNAYLEAETREKVFIIAPTGFGDLEDYTLIIRKALYGLQSFRLCWHENLPDALHDLGFESDPDVMFGCATVTQKMSTSK
jgi:Reverse transcriptase (RNA-dependent DNA polymerase)